MIANSTAAGWVHVDLPGGSVVLTNANGGVSGGTWASPRGGGGANMGDHVGDDPGAVAANRALLAGLLPPGCRAVWMNQIHSAICADAAGDGPSPEAPGEAAGRSAGAGTGRTAATSAPIATADALLSTQAGLCPAVVVADCVPLALLATDGSVAVAVHAGRAGLLAGVVANAISAARQKLSPGARLQAVIGAHICAACYEVGPELARQVEPTHPHLVTTSRWGTPALDLAAGVRHELERAGVEIAYQSRQCTQEDANYYSYRRSGPTGRQALIVIAQHAAQNHGKIPADS
ncbi:polyphenol oxidase family protein [Buchananella felis]|uniref:polyphenol oxidase family protein n=1 Tax=Buchananella felis TaxID=3231492 RepID=UPI0035298D0D